MMGQIIAPFVLRCCQIYQFRATDWREYPWALSKDDSGLLTLCDDQHFPGRQHVWNDFFGPLICLAGNPENFSVTVGLTVFNTLCSQATNLIWGLVFFLAQRFFMQGVVVTGVEKMYYSIIEKCTPS